MEVVLSTNKDLMGTFNWIINHFWLRHQESSSTTTTRITMILKGMPFSFNLACQTRRACMPFYFSLTPLVFAPLFWVYVKSELVLRGSSTLPNTQWSCSPFATITTHIHTFPAAERGGKAPAEEKNSAWMSSELLPHQFKHIKHDQTYIKHDQTWSNVVF